MEVLYLVKQGLSLKLEVTAEVNEAYLKEKTDGLVVVQRMEIITRFAGELNKKNKIYKNYQWQN